MDAPAQSDFFPTIYFDTPSAGWIFYTVYYQDRYTDGSHCQCIGVAQAADTLAGGWLLGE